MAIEQHDDLAAAMRMATWAATNQRTLPAAEVQDALIVLAAEVERLREENARLREAANRGWRVGGRIQPLIVLDGIDTPAERDEKGFVRSSH